MIDLSSLDATLNKCIGHLQRGFARHGLGEYGGSHVVLGQSRAIEQMLPAIIDLLTADNAVGFEQRCLAVLCSAEMFEYGMCSSNTTLFASLFDNRDGVRVVSAEKFTQYFISNCTTQIQLFELSHRLVQQVGRTQ